MSTNEANIKITVDDSDLVTTDNRLERVETGLEAVAREARQAGNSFRQVGVAAGGAVAGLMTMELAKRALGGAVRGATASIRAFAETNEEAQASLGVMSDSLEDLKLAFGEALIGGDNAAGMAANLSAVMEELTGFVEENKEAIQEFASGALERIIQLFTAASTVALNFAEGILFVQIAIEDFNNSVNDSADRVDQFGNAIETDRDRLQQMSNSVVDLRESLQSLNFDEIAAETNAGTNGWIDYANSVMGAARAHEEVRRSRRGSSGVDEEAAKVLSQAQLIAEAEFQSGLALKQSLHDKDLARKEAGQLLLEEQALIQQKQLESQAEFLRLTAEQEKEAARAMNESKLAGQEKLNAAMEEQRKKMTNLTVGAAQSLEKAILAVSSGSAKERKKALKKALGQELLSRGGALVAQGIGNAIALNPIGALQIAGGASMIAAGAKLGGGGGGGKGGGAPAARSTPAAATSNTQNITYNQQTQFGFVGDPRAATRQIEELNRKSMDRGL
jgi:hypothetical protein